MRLQRYPVDEREAQHCHLTAVFLRYVTPRTQELAVVKGCAFFHQAFDDKPDLVGS